MRTCLWMFSSIIFLLMSLQVHAQDSRQADNSADAIIIPQLDNIVIDGDAQDWADEGYQVVVMTDEYGLALPKPDYDPRFRLAWDDRGLLLLLQIQDDTLAECPKEKLDFYSARRGSLYDLIQIISVPLPFKDRHYMCGLAPVQENHSPPTTQLFDRSRVEALEGLRAEAVQTLLPDGYQFEVLLPWSNLEIQPEAGKEFALQIAASDYDGGNERFRACWVKADSPVDNPQSVNLIRLGGEASSPQESVARASNRPAGLPWAHFVATSEHIGASAVTRSNGQPIGEIALHDENGRAVGSILLPQPADAQTYDNLSLELDGRKIASEEIESIAAMGKLSAQTHAEAESPENVALVIGLADDQKNLLSGKKVEVQILDLNGDAVREVQAALQTPIPLTLSPGIYRINATAETSGDWLLKGTGALIAGDEKESVARLLKQAQEAESDPGMAAYTGWFDYLARQIQNSYPPVPENEKSVRTLQLAEWLARAKRDVQAYEHKRGVFEWAYLSEADENGQPFQISIPDNYNSVPAWPLEVWMHGADGMHYETPEDWTDSYKGNFIAVRVLGRGRLGGYRDLSEVDVLDAIDYVKSHWNIDPRQVHLGGGSMGGYGTFNLASRHPDRFASARIFCGGGLQVPVQNMLHVPVYGLHDWLDWTVVIEQARTSLARLDQFGGKVIFEESKGHGHRAKENKAGVERSNAWFLRQRIPERVDRVHYTATDELAKGAYWVEVKEWGPDGAPATIDARIGSGNELYLSLDNVNTAQIDLAQSPADLKLPMFVSINRTWFQELPAPLPEKLYTIRDGKEWLLTNTPPNLPEHRLHFPGGAKALYHGEPILIVWGTLGEESADQTLYDIAQVARRSSSAYWAGSDRLREGMPADYSLYGELPAKADTEVTEDDMRKYNLVLLGNASQNAVVERIADRLPVRIEDNLVKSNDEQTWPFDHRALGLLHYNPLEPKRLIYWIAADRLEFYRPDAALLERQRWVFAPPDFLLMNDAGSQLIAARRFNSRWNWEAGYSDSPHVSAVFAEREGNARILANMLRQAANTDFALVQFRSQSLDPVYAVDETRLMDIVTLDIEDEIAVIALTGEKLLEMDRRIESTGKKDDTGNNISLFTETDTADIDPNNTYRVALMSSLIQDYVQMVKEHPLSFELTGTTLRQAWQRNWTLMTESSK